MVTITHGYFAKGAEIWVKQATADKAERFCTIHETDTGGTKTVEEQAETLAAIINTACGIST